MKNLRSMQHAFAAALVEKNLAFSRHPKQRLLVRYNKLFCTCLRALCFFFVCSFKNNLYFRREKWANRQKSAE